MNIKGEVKKVFERNAKTGTFFSICVADENSGEDVWTGTGKGKPKCREGDIVEFESTRDGKYFSVDADDVKVVGGGATPRAASGGGGWNDPSRQKSIVAQSSMKMAIDFVNMALVHGALSLGTAKAPVKFDILGGAVLEKAGEFFAIAMSPDDHFGEDDNNPNPEDDGDYKPV